jgi:hypothetical protein
LTKNQPSSGFYLTEPHPAWIYLGLKSLIVRPAELTVDLDKELILLGDQAYGIIKLISSKVITLSEFKKLRGSHRISEPERTDWAKSTSEWGTGPFFAYEFEFKPYKQPREWTVEIKGVGDPLITDAINEPIILKEEADIILKPKGPWGDGFPQCIAYVRRKKGWGEERARRYCGAIHQRQQKKAQHSRFQCMDCPKLPTIEVLWAEGRAHAWFCSDHFEKWVGEVGTDEISAQREIYGVASESWSDPICRRKADELREDQGLNPIDKELINDECSTCMAKAEELSIEFDIDGTFTHVDLISKQEDSFIIAGYGSFDIVDKQGDRVSLEALNEAFTRMMTIVERRNLMFHHSNIQIGRILPEYRDSNGKVWKSGIDDRGLFIIAEIFSDLEQSKKVKRQMERGHYLSFSIGGQATKRRTVCDGFFF